MMGYPFGPGGRGGCERESQALIAFRARMGNARIPRVTEMGWSRRSSMVSTYAEAENSCFKSPI